MSSKTRRNRERRHRRMDENRALANELSLQLREMIDENERAELERRYLNARARSTRSANKLS